jgi:hypothetical protein
VKAQREVAMSKLFLIIGVLFFLSFIPLAFVVLRSYRKLRGPRVVVCPETSEPVAVEVAAMKAALGSVGGEPELRLSSCTRWPERQDCGQQCLAEIALAPDGCLVRERLTAWYANKRCSLCGRGIGEIHWYDRKPALLAPDLTTVEWSSVAPRDLPAVLTTHRALCWNCMVAESFLRQHPDRVVQDPRGAAPAKTGKGGESAA